MTKTSGQILPVVAILLAALLVFVRFHGERANLGNQKIAAQIAADSLALVVVNDQARALNSIAALNEGLRTALHRGYAYAAALLALGVCAGFVNPPCALAFKRLSSNAPAFFKKLQRLVSTLANWQDELKRWAEISPERAIAYYNGSRNLDLAGALSGSFSFASLLDPPARLRIRRANKGAYGDKAGFADGEDVLQCDSRFFAPHQFENVRALWARGGFGKRDKLTVTYVAFDGSGRTRALVDEKPRRNLNQGSLNFRYDRAEYMKCVSFYDLLGSLLRGIPTPLKVPPPYVVEAEFRDQQRVRVQIAQTARSSKATDAGKSRALKHLGPLPFSLSRFTPHEAISEAGFDQEDLNQMTFRPSMKHRTGTGNVSHIPSEVDDAKLFH